MWAHSSPGVQNAILCSGNISYTSKGFVYCLVYLANGIDLTDLVTSRRVMAGRTCVDNPLDEPTLVAMC